MPLWKINHPVGAYTAQDKKDFSEAISTMYMAVPIPKFYVVVMFEEVAAENMYVGAEPHDKFVRFQIDHMARTLPGPIMREWWVRSVDVMIKPWVGDRGYEHEFTISEVPADLWSINGEIPPPFESRAEARWVVENKPSPYTQAEMIPVKAPFTPGNTQGSLAGLA